MNIRDRASKHLRADKMPKRGRKRVRKVKVDSGIDESGYSWKPTEIPSGFILVVDTAEQLPLFDPIPIGLCVVRQVIPVGDYSVFGFEDKICIERKKVSDFFAYIGREHDETARKLRYMSQMHWAGLVVEADIDDLYDPSIPTALTREHVRGFFKALRVRYGVHVLVTGDRNEIERYVLDSLTYAYKIYHGEIEQVEGNEV